MSQDPEQLFSFLMRRYNITIDYNRRIKNASHMTVTPAYCLLSVRASLSPAQRREAVTVQLVRLNLGQVGKRNAWCPEYRVRREWVEALRLTADHLIPLPLVLQAEQEEWTPGRLAEEAGVSYRLALVRMADYLSRKNAVPFFTLLPDITRLSGIDIYCNDCMGDCVGC